MPTKGYQTITIRTSVYVKLLDAYEKRKRDLIMDDIKSYTGYAQSLLERAIEQDVLEGRFEIIAHEDNKVIVKDYFRMRDSEVVIKGGRVFCRLDETGNCDHVGFVLSDPVVVKRARELGVRLRKSAS